MAANHGSLVAQSYSAEFRVEVSRFAAPCVSTFSLGGVAGNDTSSACAIASPHAGSRASEGSGRILRRLAVRWLAGSGC